MHLNISSLSYHHQELHNHLYNMETKPKIIGIPESRLQINKQPINNISLPNYVPEHTPTEPGKRDTPISIDPNLRCKVKGDLKRNSKALIETTFIEIMNTKRKNKIIECIYKHQKQGIYDFNNNYILPLMDKLSRQKKDILISMIDDKDINDKDINGKHTTTFLDTLSNSFSLFCHFAYLGSKHFRNSNRQYSL